MLYAGAAIFNRAAQPSGSAVPCGHGAATVTVVVAVAWLSGVRRHVSEYWVVTIGVTVTEPDTLLPV